MTQPGSNGTQMKSDDAFFVDIRSSKVDDALDGRISFGEYFDYVDATAKKIASEDTVANAAKNERLDNLLRRVSRTLFLLLLVVFPAVYILIGVAAFMAGDMGIRWISIATGVLMSLGTFLLRGKFAFIGHRT